MPPSGMLRQRLIDAVVNTASASRHGSPRRGCQALFDADFRHGQREPAVNPIKCRRAPGGEPQFRGGGGPIPFQAHFTRRQGGVSATPWRWLTSCGPTVTVCAVQPGISTRASPPHGKDHRRRRRVRRPYQPPAARMEQHDEQTGMDPAAKGAFIAKA